MSKIRGFSRNRQQSFPSNIRNGHAFQIAMDRFHSLTHKSLSSVRCFYAKFDSVSIWITESCYCELVFGFRSLFEMYQEPRSQLLNFAFPVCFSLFFAHFIFFSFLNEPLNSMYFCSSAEKKLAKSVQILSINCLPLNHRSFGIFLFYTFHLSLTCPQSYQVSLLCVLLFFFLRYILWRVLPIYWFQKSVADVFKQVVWMMYIKWNFIFSTLHLMLSYPWNA